MAYDQDVVHTLYKKLLGLYPSEFRECLGESMEQSFQDFYREHLLLISPGHIMQAILKPLSSSAFISLLLILPFIIMEVVNRRNFNEGFPFVLFFMMWLNLFAVSLILLPILRGSRTENHDVSNSVLRQGNTLLTNPRSAAIISVVVLLSPGILPLMDFVGWLSLDRLFNGPNPEVAYLPGLVLLFGLLLFPIAAGVIAARPIVSTLQAGGSLFAHPINLIIVVLILSTFVIALTGLIIDQWPCFIGVPNCD
jgi:hypothetical protein